MAYRQLTHDENLRFASAQASAGNPSRHIWLVDWKAHGLPYSCVYVVSPDNHWPCKIGRSTHARQRVSAIQVSVWRPIKVDYSVWCKDDAEAARLEKAIHMELDAEGKWLNGEWFDMRAPEAVSLFKSVAAIYGVDINDRIEDEAIVKGVEADIRYYADPRRENRLPRMSKLDILED